MVVSNEEFIEVNNQNKYTLCFSDDSLNLFDIWLMSDFKELLFL